MKHPSKKSKLVLGLTLGSSLVAAGLGASAVGAAHAGPTLPSDKCAIFKVAPHSTKAVLSKCASDPPKDVPPVAEAGAGVFPFGPSNFNINWNPPYEGGTAASHRMTGINGFAPAAGDGDCPVGTTDVVWNGNIGPLDTTDPGNGDVGATVNAATCVTNASGAITLEAGTLFTFGQPPGGK
jgi:hypothetical protein